MVYFITFILAFCSIVYEVVLAQSLSAFLDNTVLRYSVTIGLYMFSMGVGAMLAEGRFVKNAVLNLLRIEIFLTVIGGFLVVWLHLFDMAGMSRLLFSLSAHMMIIVIGVLTGFEIPLLIEMKNEEKKDSENIVLAVNYAGAFVGTILFAFVFFPLVGLMPTAFLIGLLNAVAGSLLFTQRKRIVSEKTGSFHVTLGMQICLLLVVSICLFYSGGISEFFIQGYLG